MKLCCHRSFKWVRDEDLGERTLKHYRCRACGHPRKRNVKKTRYTTRKTPVVQSPAKRPKTLQRPPTGKRKAIRPVSDKRKAQNAQYLLQRKAFLERRPSCEIERCGKPATECHHSAGKEGEWLLREEFWFPACRQCHDFVETNRSWAKEKGYLKLRLTTDQINQTAS